MNNIKHLRHHHKSALSWAIIKLLNKLYLSIQGEVNAKRIRISSKVSGLVDIECPERVLKKFTCGQSNCAAAYHHKQIVFGQFQKKTQTLNWNWANWLQWDLKKLNLLVCHNVVEFIYSIVTSYVYEVNTRKYLFIRKVVLGCALSWLPGSKSFESAKTGLVWMLSFWGARSRLGFLRRLMVNLGST